MSPYDLPTVPTQLDYIAAVAEQKHNPAQGAWPCLPLEEDPEAVPVWDDDWHAAYVTWGLAV